MAWGSGDRSRKHRIRRSGVARRRAVGAGAPLRPPRAVARAGHPPRRALLPDYELLELLPSSGSLPQGDARPLAQGAAGPLRRDRRRALGPAGGAEDRQGRRALGGARPEAATRGDAAHRPRRGARSACRSRPGSAHVAYARAALAHEPREQFRVLFLDKKNQLIADGGDERGHRRPRLSLSARGGPPGAGASSGRSAVILVHNHPSGAIRRRRPPIST